MSHVGREAASHHAASLGAAAKLVAAAAIILQEGLLCICVALALGRTLVVEQHQDAHHHDQQLQYRWQCEVGGPHATCWLHQRLHQGRLLLDPSLHTKQQAMSGHAKWQLLNVWPMAAVAVIADCDATTEPEASGDMLDSSA